MTQISELLDEMRAMRQAIERVEQLLIAEFGPPADRAKPQHAVYNEGERLRCRCGWASTADDKRWDQGRFHLAQAYAPPAGFGCDHDWRGAPMVDKRSSIIERCVKCGKARYGPPGLPGEMTRIE